MDAPLVRRSLSRARLAVFAVAAASLVWLAPGQAQAQESLDLSAQMDLAVRAAAAVQAGGGVQAADAVVLRAVPVTWSDGCLGGSDLTGTVCTTALVPGWVVWVSAGSNVYRFHTDLDGGAINFSSSNILESQVASSPLPVGATYRFVSGGNITGDIPPEGIALFAIQEIGTRDSILDELADNGCEVVSLSVTVDGEFVSYVPGAPDFVNADFASSFGAGGAFAVRCAEGSDLRDFDTDLLNRTARLGNGALVGVSFSQHDGYDRVVFEFGDELGDTDLTRGVPAYRVEYLDGPAVACGSGMEVDPEGVGTLQVTFPTTFVYDPDSGEPTMEQTVFGEDHQVIFETQQVCAFEANSTWVIGTGGEAPFRVYELSNPTRLVIDLQVPED